jgi:predicted N-acetyltransferase YhbS
VLDDSRHARYDRLVQLPSIRPMIRSDVDPIVASFLRNDWGDRRLNLEFVTAHPETHPFVAEADGVVVGTGVVSLNGPVAWIGTIFVEPAWRRRGVGMELTRVTIETAEAAGCRTLVLVATDAGRPMYERLGFEVQTWYRILQAPGVDPVTTIVDPRVRPYRPADLAAMTALDAEATGEDRGHLLRAFAAPDTTRVLDDGDGSIGGFVVRAPWGGGATIAPRLDDALAILHARRAASGAAGHVRAGLLIENETGAERLATLGWTESWRAPRLVRGDPMTWRPDAIWGQFNHAMG